MYFCSNCAVTTDIQYFFVGRPLVATPSAVAEAGGLAHLAGVQNETPPATLHRARQD